MRRITDKVGGQKHGQKKHFDEQGHLRLIEIYEQGAFVATQEF